MNFQLRRCRTDFLARSIEHLMAAAMQWLDERRPDVPEPTAPIKASRTRVASTPPTAFLASVAGLTTDPSDV
ncbi:hypothetical protein L2Y96_12800 [Luteibacter aegosomaticola]|uniref:hypothetical protein n=1 Tax=Luteibacter aegosomaticola TaxID=2911538 RepID=UPI001FF8FF9E|nr:hypothetical protein [Luteibacter aegosomaticola]UPG88299.1 hypothetical protein L2Y96_12800 [Luteibacter aegosomaticola]